jgi:hypothetical protein
MLALVPIQASIFRGPKYPSPWVFEISSLRLALLAKYGYLKKLSPKFLVFFTARFLPLSSKSKGG